MLMPVAEPFNDYLADVVAQLRAQGIRAEVDYSDDRFGKKIRNAPFINHTDQELMLIETLVGRTPPFVFPKSDYSGPRRNY